MARSRTAPASTRRRRPAAAEQPGLAETAERMIAQIEELVAEIVSLRADNAALREEVAQAVDMLDRASLALGDAGPAAGAGRRRRRPAAPVSEQAAEEPRRRPAAPRARGRVTPSTITPQVVMAVIGKLGNPTAKEIAEDIGRAAGVPVSGRAVRFLAERAGALSEVVEGQRRYRVS